MPNSNLIIKDKGIKQSIQQICAFCPAPGTEVVEMSSTQNE